MVCTAMSAAGSPHANSDDNPYEVTNMYLEFIISASDITGRLF